MATACKYQLMSSQDVPEEGYIDPPLKEREAMCGLWCLRGSVVSLLLTVVVLMALLTWSLSQAASQVCLSEACVDVSAYIQRKMNRSADPCQDFYTYSCGGWESHTFIPPERAKFDTFAEVSNNNKAIIKKLLDDDTTVFKGHNSSAIAKLKAHYRTCMNVSKIEADGIGPILKIIKDLGGWSVQRNVTSLNASGEWDLVEALVRHRKLGQSPFFDFGISVDSRNNSRYLLSFDQAGLTLDSRLEYLQNTSDSYHQAFLAFAVKTGELLGGGSNTPQAMENVYQLEKSLAQIFVPKEKLVDPTSQYNLMSVAEFQKEIGDQIDVKRLMSGIMNKDIRDSQIVLVPTIDYFRQLGAVLSNTSQQVLQDYLMWHLLQRLPGYLPQVFVDAVMPLNKAELGVTSTSPRWQRCVSKVEAAFGYAVAALYVHKTFPPKSKARALEILTAVQREFLSNLNHLSWMDAATRVKATAKVKAMGKVVGYPDWIVDPVQLDEYYDKAEIKEGEFLHNFFSVSQFEVAKMWGKFKKKPTDREWSMLPSDVNGFFSSTHNQIVLLAGLLQRPYFDLHFPLSFAYGAMGMISGHELTHGFDNMGRMFDAEGNMKDWWSNQSATTFKHKSQCMVQQYSNYSIGGHKLNGEYTLSENIADNGGLKLAYNAYQTRKALSTSPEPKLPALNLSPKQLFFVGFAQIWCAYYTPEYTVTAIRSDEHSIAKYRVHGALANLPHFAEAFQCPAQSSLHSTQPCSVW